MRDIVTTKQALLAEHAQVQRECVVWRRLSMRRFAMGWRNCQGIDESWWLSWAVDCRNKALAAESAGVESLADLKMDLDELIPDAMELV